MSQLSELVKRAELDAKLAEQPTVDDVHDNLDSVLDGMDDDELTFNFDD